MENEKIKNQNKKDAMMRVDRVRVGSLQNATTEYADALEEEIYDWLKEIREHRKAYNF